MRQKKPRAEWRCHCGKSFPLKRLLREHAVAAGAAYHGDKRIALLAPISDAIAQAAKERS